MFLQSPHFLMDEIVPWMKLPKDLTVHEISFTLHIWMNYTRFWMDLCIYPTICHQFNYPSWMSNQASFKYSLEIYATCHHVVD